MRLIGSFLAASAIIFGTVAAGWFYLESTSPRIDIATPTPLTGDSFNSGSISVDTAPRVLNIAATSWDSQSRLDGGAVVSVGWPDIEAEVQLSPSGDLSAVTDNPDRPEWRLIGPTLYARLGEAELMTNRDALVSLGKADANWTDAAVGSEREREFLNLADMAKVASAVASSGQVTSTGSSGDGGYVISATVPTEDLGGFSSITDSDRVEVDVTLDGSRAISVISLSTSDGVDVTVRLVSFQQVAVTAPPDRAVITITDLIALAKPVQEPVPQAPRTQTSQPPASAR